MRTRAWLGGIGLLVFASCATLTDDVGRAESAYEQARYDAALVWLSDLEDDAADMPLDMRARFFYLRGMTAYRLGQRDEALYFLSVGRELAGDRATALRQDYRQQLDRALAELIPTTATFHARPAPPPAVAE